MSYLCHKSLVNLKSLVRNARREALIMVVLQSRPACLESDLLSSAVPVERVINPRLSRAAAFLLSARARARVPTPAPFPEIIL